MHFRSPKILAAFFVVVWIADRESLSFVRNPTCLLHKDSDFVNFYETVKFLLQMELQTGTPFMIL